MEQYIAQMVKSLERVDLEMVKNLAEEISFCERLFIIGNGGNAVDAIHAASDFRKLCGIPSYTIDLAELSARANDEGWKETFRGWLDVSKIDLGDGLLVLSVGGGNSTSSENITEAIVYAKDAGATVMGITGPSGGDTARLSHVCVRVSVDDPSLVTPITHSVQSAILHYLFVRLHI